MKNWVFAGTAAAVLAAAGVVHGFWTDRWARNEATDAAVARLQDVPLQVGEWQGEDIDAPHPVPGVAGTVQRRYVNHRLGATVVLALVNGRPGPVATHTPEVCYGANGFNVGPRQAVTVPGGGGKFWTADASKTTVTQQTRIRLYWAWNGGGGWVASADARHEFPRHKCGVLHKLYVIRELAGPRPPADQQDPCEEFLAALLPVLHEALFTKG
jgi:hypothetical protein